MNLFQRDFALLDEEEPFILRLYMSDWVRLKVAGKWEDMIMLCHIG